MMYTNRLLASGATEVRRVNDREHIAKFNSALHGKHEAVSIVKRSIPHCRIIEACESGESVVVTYTSPKILNE